MDVYLDGERLDGAGTTLSDTLDAARSRVGVRRLIIEAYADGREIPQGHLQEPPTTDPYAAEVKLISAETARLVQGPLMQASEAVGALEGRHAEIAELLQSGAIADALGELGQALETWTTAKSVLELAAQIIGPEIAGDQANIDAAIGELAKALAELKDAMERRDWSGLADALEFDIDPLASSWSDILRSAASNACADSTPV